jgi:hypothetical protein
MRRVRTIGVALALGVLGVSAASCGGDDDSSDGVKLTPTTVKQRLDQAEYLVADRDPGGLPSLVSADFATGPDSGFESAYSVSGDGLAPYDPQDISETGFIVFYGSADEAARADDGLGEGEGQFVENNVLFVAGNALDPPSNAFEQMMDTALGQTTGPG